MAGYVVLQGIVAGYCDRVLWQGIVAGYCGRVL